MKRKEIILEARKKECWSVNKKHNYGPIDYMHDNWFRGKFSSDKVISFYKFVRLVTDAETFFVWLLKGYDVFVRVSQLVWEFKKAFPEVSNLTINQWLKEFKASHHIYC